jgi:hypothetical protein
MSDKLQFVDQMRRAQESSDQVVVSRVKEPAKRVAEYSLGWSEAEPQEFRPHHAQAREAGATKFSVSRKFNGEIKFARTCSVARFRGLCFLIGLPPKPSPSPPKGRGAITKLPSQSSPLLRLA